jgi:hypothetical protein
VMATKFNSCQLLRQGKMVTILQVLPSTDCRFSRNLLLAASSGVSADNPFRTPSFPDRIVGAIQHLMANGDRVGAGIAIDAALSGRISPQVVQIGVHWVVVSPPKKLEASVMIAPTCSSVSPFGDHIYGSYCFDTCPTSLRAKRQQFARCAGLKHHCEFRILGG